MTFLQWVVKENVAIFLLYFLLGFGAEVPVEMSRPPSPQLFKGDTEAFLSQPRDVISPSCPGSALRSLVGHIRNTTPTRRPGGILVRCPNDLSWLLSMQRISGSWVKSRYPSDKAHLVLSVIIRSSWQ